MGYKSDRLSSVIVVLLVVVGRKAPCSHSIHSLMDVEIHTG